MARTISKTSKKTLSDTKQVFHQNIFWVISRRTFARVSATSRNDRFFKNQLQNKFFRHQGPVSSPVRLRRRPRLWVRDQVRALELHPSCVPMLMPMDAKPADEKVQGTRSLVRTVRKYLFEQTCFERIKQIHGVCWLIIYIPMKIRSFCKRDNTMWVFLSMFLPWVFLVKVIISSQIRTFDHVIHILRFGC